MNELVAYQWTTSLWSVNPGWETTILNLLVKDANAKTQEYSQALNLGRQTTTVTTLYDLDRAQGFVIDSPGFQGVRTCSPNPQ